jgi:DNA-binding SARP family transcriptional activator/tetratricopeptide (TPR) repeat protein
LVSNSFELGLLGTPIMRWQSAPFDVPRRQARALLYRLATTLQPVARDGLVLLLWPNATDAAARRNFTRLLSALRRELPHPEILQATSTTVSLNSKLVWSDAATFKALVDSRDAAHWARAVSLVRGPFLDGFSLPDSVEFDAWQCQQQHVIERRYLALLAQLVCINRQRGQLKAAIDYARCYLTTDDLAEEIHRQLIELYAQTGERSAALRQFEQCVLVLERDLGVAPLPETRTAYEAARDGRQLAAPEALPEPEWAVLPTLDLPLLGREEPLAALTEAYARLRSGGVIFITGEAGVGKSRLMQAFARRSDALVLTGNSPAETAALAYQPLVQALRQALSLRSRWRQTAPIWLAETARLLPELQTHFPDLPPAVGVEPEQAQGRLYEALCQVFAGLATASPLLLCLDDVHWADGATRGWLYYLSGRLSGSQICIITTYRSPEQALLAEWQRMLRRANLMVEVALGGLAETAVAGLLDQLPHRIPQHQHLAAHIHRATGGNAFFVLETIRELLSIRQLTADAHVPLPPTVREAVLRRAGRLTPLARQLLEVTALLSPATMLATIAKTAGRDELESAVALEELVDGQMLRSEGEQFHFQHELARDAIYEAISPWRRRLLHRRAAITLASLQLGNGGLIAAHFEAAGEVEQAVNYYKNAADFAQHIYANQEAVTYYNKVLNLTNNERLDLQVEIYERLGQLFRRQAQYERAEQAYKLMHKVATEIDNIEMVAQSWLRLGALQDSLRQYSDSLESAENAWTLAVKHHLNVTRVFAQYAQAWALFRLGQLDEALPLAKEALEQSYSMDRCDLMALNQNTLGAIYKYLGYYQLSAQHQQSALDLFRQLGDRRRVAGVLNNLGETARLQDDLLKACEHYKEAVEIAEQIGERDWLVEFLSNLGNTQLKLKKYPEATVAFSKAIALVNSTTSQVTGNLYRNLADALIAERRWTEAVACLTECQHIFTAIGADEEVDAVTELLSQLEPNNRIPHGNNDHHSQGKRSF